MHSLCNLFCPTRGGGGGGVAVAAKEVPREFFLLRAKMTSVTGVVAVDSLISFRLLICKWIRCAARGQLQRSAVQCNAVQQREEQIPITTPRATNNIINSVIHISSSRNQNGK